jgi:hypothetical protein
LSGKRFRFPSTISTALQRLLQLGGETEHEGGRHVADVRLAGSASAVEKLQEALEGIKGLGPA